MKPRDIPLKDGKTSRVYVVHWRERGRLRKKHHKRQSDALNFRAEADAAERAGLTVEELRAAQVEAPAPDGPAPSTPARAGVTLADTFTAWQATRRVSRGRVAADASLSKRFGELGTAPVDTITPSMVRAHLAELSDLGLSAETVSAVLRLLRQVLDVAVEDGHAPTNPAARVKPPRIVRPPLDATDVLTVGEAHRLVAATPEWWRALVCLLVFTGARWSEALGLRRCDVDVIRKRVHLGGQVAEEVAGSIVVRPSGKTRGSDRVIPLPAVVVTALNDHIAVTDPEPDGLLFAGAKGTLPLRGNFRRTVWLPTVKRAGLEGRGLTVRNLRHTAASIMLQAGLAPLDVARRLGHSRPSTTLDVYARFLGTEDDSGDVLDGHLGAPPVGTKWEQLGTGSSNRVGLHMA